MSTAAEIAAEHIRYARRIGMTSGDVMASVGVYARQPTWDAAHDAVVKAWLRLNPERPTKRRTGKVENSQKDWSFEHDALLIALIEEGEPIAVIAGKLGRTEIAVDARINVLNLRPIDLASRETKRRNCLMCGTGFNSRHAGERVCKQCKTTEAWQSGGGYDVPCCAPRVEPSGEGGRSS